MFGFFDTALSVRCLINLMEWPLQKQAIDNIASVLKSGSRFVFVEGRGDGRDALDRLRQSVGLPAMPKVWHNRDFIEAEVLDYLDRDLSIEKRSYLGVYDLISRVIHPLVATPEEPQFHASINKAAARLSLLRPEFLELSRVLFLVLRRR